MLDLRYVVENMEAVRENLARRGRVPEKFDHLASLALDRVEAIKRHEAINRELNLASKYVGTLPKGSPEQNQARAEAKVLGVKASASAEEVTRAERAIERILINLPNLCDPSVPTGLPSLGRLEDQNVEVHTFGEKPLIYNPRCHDEIGVSLGILDFERAAKISGPRYSVLWGQGAALERALISFMIDQHVDAGYTEVYPPAIVKDSALRGTGQLPKFEDDLYGIAPPYNEHGVQLPNSHYLIPTAEVPVTNLHADEILDAWSLPRRYVAYTPCFRSEAGAAGKDTRGLIRQHQFNKVELVHLERPENSEAALQAILKAAESILQALGLHYRVVLLCTGDMSANSRKTYDIEVWLPGQNAYREISSCSMFGDFQARRANLRYRPEPGAKPEFLHTLNGSALAVGRTLVAILEQYQQADGSVIIPPVLQPYLRGGEKIISPPRPRA